jgi:hypothetical protein
MGRGLGDDPCIKVKAAEGQYRGEGGGEKTRDGVEVEGVREVRVRRSNEGN